MFYETIGYFHNHFVITKVENTGAFLSLGNDMSKSGRSIFLLLIPAAMLVFGLVYLFIKPNLPTLALVGFSCVIGGGIANIFDRIYYGSVTDFLYIDLGIAHTGVFNLADVSIVTGLLLVLLQSLLSRKKPKEPSGETAAAAPGNESGG